MEIAGETRIAAPRPRVWEALNDIALLARCIEGVESFEPAGENRYAGRMAAKVGPVRATFAGTIELQNLDPPNGYTLTGEGKGGAAGFAKGSADVRLAEDGPDATILRYSARAATGGKLAQLGARLLEGTARQMADKFFAALKLEIEGPAEAAPATAQEPDAAVPAAPAIAPESGGLPVWVWAGALALIVAAFLLFQTRG